MAQQRRDGLLVTLGEHQGHAVWCQHLSDLRPRALGQGQCMSPHVDRQPPPGDRGERRPHPVGRARQARDRRSLAALTCCDRTEQGKEFIKLDLGDAHVVEEMPAEGCRMVGHLPQPGPYGMGGDLEHPRHGTDAQAFRESAHGPHEPFG